MSLEDDIKDRFVSDTDSILEDCMDDLDGVFQFHGDGTIDVLGDYRQLDPKNLILVYLIAQRYKFEANMVDDPSLEYDYFYDVLSDKDQSTIRHYFGDLRDDGLIQKTPEGHQIVVERLRGAIDRIEAAVG